MLRACGGWSATIAAYRFFRNGEIEWTDVMRPNWSALWPGRVDIWRWSRLDGVAGVTFCCGWVRLHGATLYFARRCNHSGRV
ncbi:hypothetical protein [Cupriavidus basilensis]